MREMGNQIEVEPAGRASGGLDLPGHVFAADLTSQIMFPVALICQVMGSPGVSAQSLVGEGGQLPLFDSDRRVGRLNAVLDRIHDKFGSAAVTTADLHAAPGKKRE
jgi:hypothetical protein